MSAGEAVAFHPGRLGPKLAAVLTARIKAALGRTYEFLDANRWASAHEKGLAHVRLIGAVDWLLGLVAFTQKPMDEEFAVLREQRARIGFVDWTAQPASAAHITVPDYFVAAAVADWRDDGPNQAYLKEAVRIAEAWRASEGGLERVLADVPRDGGWQRLLATKFAREFVCRAVLGDWAGIAALHAAGFRYLDETANPSATGLLIGYSIRLAELTQSPSEEGQVRCRDALQRCVHSWRMSLAADEVWDASLTLLYLCVWSFERVMNDRRVSALNVGAVLLGDAASAPP